MSIFPARIGVWLGVGAGFLVAVGFSGLGEAAGLAPVDSDGDGHASIASGGDDCDDTNARRFPGAGEVCDSAHLDEDCNPNTFGQQDSDGDGYFKAQCCNRTHNAVNCGNDPDDSNPAIKPGAIECSGEMAHVVRLNGVHAATPCASGTVCIDQPNATGVCGAQPPGYKAPGTKKFWKRPSPTGAVKKGKNIRPGTTKKPGVKLPKGGPRPKLR